MSGSGWEKATVDDRLAAMRFVVNENNEIIFERLGALEKRISAMASASAKCPSAPMPYEADTMTHEPAPSLPAPLVERMAEAMFNVRHPGTMPWERVSKAVQDEYRTDARAALRVAAEGLLGTITGEEWDAVCAGAGRPQPGALTEALLRSRLAAALEACR